ncbi:MAG: hypothetical protein U0V56_02625 [Actinomycetota bacterium]
MDAFGIGTQLGVSADAPYVDFVYKLVESNGEPVLKLSAAKQTAPGRKQAWRGTEHDVLALREEAGPGDGFEPLLRSVIRGGERIEASPSLEAMRERFAADLAALPTKARRLRHAEPVEVRPSAALVALTASAREDALRRAGVDG